MIVKHTPLLVFFLALVFLAPGCADKWDEHNEINDNSITLNLFEKISQDADLSTFRDFLVRTGYADSISNSMSYTVWAPNNQALSTLDQSIVGDSLKLKKFVANHISHQSYLTTMANDSLRVRTLGGKYEKFSTAKFETANIITANKYAKNGIFHIIDKGVVPKLSIWEYVKASTEAPKQRDFLVSLEKVVFDSSAAVIEKYDALGNPIYKPGTGEVLINKYFKSVANLADESKQFTFLLIKNTGWDTEYGKLTPFYASTSINPDSTTEYLSSFNLVKDLSIKGAYTANNLPAGSLVSVNNIKVPITSAMLSQAQSYEASNGMVYILDQLNFDLEEKFQPIIIEGESSNIFFGNASPNGGFTYRALKDLNGKAYKDIQVYDSRASSMSVFYRIHNVPSGTYNVYWRAIAGVQGDRQTVSFQQRVGYQFGSISNPITYLNYTSVGLASDLTSYNEKLVGQMVVNKYGSYNIYLNAAASASVNVNTLVLDYLKFVPVIP